MEIKVLKKPIEVLVGKKDKYGFRLRQPTMGELEEMVSLTSNEQTSELVDKMIIDWLNKPKLVDEDENVIEYETLSEFRDLTLSNELLNLSVTLLNQELKKRAEFTKK